MNPQNSPVEIYLRQISDCLAHIPVSQQADIVLEIKSHLDEAIDKNPQRAYSELFTELGTPSEVASRYLESRNLPPIPVRQKKSGIHWLRWIVGGGVVSLAMTLLMIVWLINHFTPLISVSDEGFSLLGGAMTVKEYGDGSKVQRHWNSNPTGKNFFRIDKKTGDGFNFYWSSKFNAEGAKVDAVHVKWIAGRMRISAHKGAEVEVVCRGTIHLKDEPVNRDNSILRINLETSNAEDDFDCQLLVPKGIAVNAQGDAGKLDIEEPDFRVDAHLKVGRLVFAPAANVEYRFENAVLSGTTDKFPPSKPEGHFIKLAVDQGQIAYEN
jgi:hypothetical protein